MTWKVGDLTTVRGECGRWTLVRLVEVGERDSTAREVLIPLVFNGFGSVSTAELEAPTEEELAVYLAQEIAK